MNSQSINSQRSEMTDLEIEENHITELTKAYKDYNLGIERYFDNNKSCIMTPTLVDSLDNIYLDNYVEIGDQALWSLSSSKDGNGIEQLRDGDLNTFWQSDALAPHIITLQFDSEVNVRYVCLYVDHGADESYTPEKISIRAGHVTWNLSDVTTAEFTNPTGWFVIPLSSTENSSPSISCYLLEIMVLSSSHGGKDCHIRQVRIFSNPSDYLSVHIPSEYMIIAGQFPADNKVYLR